VNTWEDLLKHKTRIAGTMQSLNQMKKEIQESINALNEEDALFFDTKLPNSEKWRCYKEFRDSCIFFDIETTGLDFEADELTTIVTYDGNEIKSFVSGENLEEFADYIMEFSMCVTFYGNEFDIPFLTRKLDIYPALIQMDLFYELKSLGYKGGLKKIEHDFEINRGDLEDISGKHAIILWDMYQEKRDKNILDTLLSYNCADVLSLKFLADSVYNLKCQKLGFPDEKIKDIAEIPKNPYSVDRNLLQKLKEIEPETETDEENLD
jgi:uncharacterized protein YprB with RNaseH-like and TPR domain